MPPEDLKNVVFWSTPRQDIAAEAVADLQAAIARLPASRALSVRSDQDITGLLWAAVWDRRRHDYVVQIVAVAGGFRLIDLRRDVWGLEVPCATVEEVAVTLAGMGLTGRRWWESFRP